MSEIDPPCLVMLRELKAAIDARLMGKGVQSVGHKGRNLAYADLSPNQMIAYYMQLWRQCPEAQAELPELSPLDAPIGTRGRPAIFMGSGRV